MRTEYSTGYKDNPADLLRRFGGRLALLDIAAEYTLTVEEVNAKHGYMADPAMRSEIALGIQELYSDFEQMRDAIDRHVAELAAKAYHKQEGAE